jgi:pimeloyl-ACP methyl ester carboxylesterase
MDDLRFLVELDNLHARPFLIEEMVFVHDEQLEDLDEIPGGYLQEVTRSFRRVPSADDGFLRYETHPFTTSDNYAIRLYRRRPAPNTASRNRPVLFLHGANSNRFCFGVKENASFTGFLNRQGYDVWVLEFRGSQSSRYLGSGKAPQNLDAKITIDLPEAIEQVLKKTGAKKVDLIGHSLGGIFIYAHLGARPDAPVGRAVAVCAPAHVRRFFGGLSKALKIPARMLAPLAPYLPGLGVHRLAKLKGPLPHLAVFARHIEKGSMDRHERRRYLDRAVEDMKGGDLAQLMRWFGEGELTTQDGASYYDAFARMRHPILLIGSDRDSIAEPDAVREAYNRLGSRHKKLLFVGKRFGSSRNYAHQDLLLAPDANQDVYPLAHRWLSQDQGR